MFYFSGFTLQPVRVEVIQLYCWIGLPHSEIPGSKLARQLPEAYRSHATAFFALISQGIHHLPVNN